MFAARQVRKRYRRGDVPSPDDRAGLRVQGVDAATFGGGDNQAADDQGLGVDGAVKRSAPGDTQVAWGGHACRGRAAAGVVIVGRPVGCRQRAPWRRRGIHDRRGRARPWRCRRTAGGDRDERGQRAKCGHGCRGTPLHDPGGAARGERGAARGSGEAARDPCWATRDQCRAATSGHLVRLFPLGRRAQAPGRSRHALAGAEVIVIADAAMPS